MDTNAGGNSSKIFNLRPSDIKSVLELSRESGLENWSQQDILSEIQREDSIVLVGKIDAQTVGFCIARLIITMDFTQNIISANMQKDLSETPPRSDDGAPHKSTADFKTECDIYNIAVARRFRRHGIGGDLLRNVIWSAKKRHAASVWLEVRDSNESAIEFYLKNGFRRIYQRKNFYSNPLENAVVMKKNLSPEDVGQTNFQTCFSERH